MVKSKASIELEEFARSLDGTYDDFVRFMGEIPQKKGIDEKLAEFIHDNPDAGYEDLFYRYSELAILGRE